ncbi:MAG: 50S ribosomal protein L18 [Patescibacteria group bacterium]
MIRTVRRRRLEAKTDYKLRLALLKSGKIRLVIRKTNRYILVQMVRTEGAQDKVLFGASSKMLLEKGWPKEKAGSLKSIPASYLTGLMLGRIAGEKVTEAVLDIGMHRNAPKSRIYAALKGVIDVGIKVSHSPEILPSPELMSKNKSFSGIFDKLREKI